MMLSRDSDGAEKVFGVFVFFAVTLMLSAFIFALIGQSGAGGHWDGGFIQIADTTYSLYEPSDGYAIDADHIVDTWDHEADTNYRFHETDPEEDDAFVIAVINDNTEYAYLTFWLDPLKVVEGVSIKPEHRYLDEFVIFVEWGWWSTETISVSYDAVISHKVAQTNQSVVEFSIRHNESYSLIVTTPGISDDFSADLEAGNFHLQVARDISDANEAETSMWAILGQILTAQTPDIGPVPNAILTMMFIPSLGFLCYVVVSRIIPFIAGA